MPTHPTHNGTRAGASQDAPNLSLPTDHLVDVRSHPQGTAILIFISVLATPLILAHANGFTSAGIILPPATPRPDAMKRVERLCETMVSATLYLPFMVGQYATGAMLFTAPVHFMPEPSSIVRTPERRATLLAAGAGFLWCTLQALGGSPIADAATRAILACSMFRSPGRAAADAPLAEAVEFSYGIVKAKSIQRRPSADSPRAGAAARALHTAAAADTALRLALGQALSATASEDPHLLSGWIERITPLAVGEVPAHLLEALPDFSDARLDETPLSDLLRPLTTSWYPQPPRQAEALGTPAECPRDARDLLTPTGARRLTSWVDHQLRDLEHVRAEKARGTPPGDIIRDRPDAIAIGQSEFLEWARGRVWDCTLAASACCTVADFSTTPLEIVSRAEVRRRLEHYPDQFLISNLLEGARLDADVELQFVLVPHLTTLPFGFESVEKEVNRLEAYGWYRSFPVIPYAPMYLNGQGATARKLEPDRWRRTTEGGGPRHPTFDAAGVRALSINEASRIHHMPAHFTLDRRPEFLEWLRRRGLPRDEPIPPADGRRWPSKWPKEVKPDLSDVMRDMAVLGRAAALQGTVVFCANDDVKDYFNHLSMASSELSKLGILLDRPDAAGPRFVSERVLGFGTHGASNIAQRLSDALVTLYYEDMDAAYFSPSARRTSSERRWLEKRLALQRRTGEPCVDVRRWTAPPSQRLPDIAAPTGIDLIPNGYACPQLRPYRLYMFTDDAQSLTVGVQVTLLSLRVWRRLTDSLRLRMAIPEKRSLGTWCKWIGVMLIPALGLVVVTRDKILRASAAISAALDGQMEFHAYRSLCGLLEHLRAVNLRGRNVMHGLYRPHGPGGASADGPNGIVRCDGLMTAQLTRWLHLLSASCGTSVKRALSRANLESPPEISFFLSSDACYSDVAIPGLGGFAHGLYWYFAVPQEDVPFLSIPILEFLGVCFNVLIFDSHLHRLGSQSAPAWVHLLTDALTSALVLADETARSPVIVEAYQGLRSTQQWRNLRPRLRISHLFGDANPLSDAISRARWAEFHQLCSQLGIHPQQVEVNADCLNLYQRAIAFLRELHSHLGSTALGVFNPNLIGDQPLAEGVAGEQPPEDMSARLFYARLYPAARPAAAPPLPPSQALKPGDRLALALQAKLDTTRRQAPQPLPPDPADPSTPEAATHGRRAGDRRPQASAPAAKRGLFAPGPTRGGPNGLALPPAPPWTPDRGSSLARASSNYAHLRRIAMSQGGEPGMALREEISANLTSGEALEEVVFFGVNANTLSTDVRAWDMWETVCRSHGTSPLRTAAEARDFPERNAHLLAALLLHAFAVCRPRQQGRRFIKPKSALAYPLAIVRIFNRWAVAMPSYKLLKAAVAGLSRAYLAYHGPYSLAPHRAEPMKFSMVRDMMRISAQPNSPTKVGELNWSDDDQNVFIFRRLICVMMFTAFRLGEIVRHTSGEIMYLTFESLTWVIGGVVVSHPTAAQLAALRPGRDGARLAPPRSKPDQTGEIHCPFSAILTFHDDDPINAAAALRDLELRDGIGCSNRSITPLFGDAEGEPYTHHFLHTMLRTVLAHLYGPRVASLYSFHSFRSGLATALHAAGVEDPMIQLICRWMCPESLHVYRRMGVAEHESLVRKASVCSVDCMQSVNAPAVVQDQALALLAAEFRQDRSDSDQEAYERAVQAAIEPYGPQQRARRPNQPPAAEPRHASGAPPDEIASLSPLAGVPLAGETVIAPREMWPNERCDELGGQGWRAVILRASPAAATIRFLQAKTARGQPYEDVCVQTSLLMTTEPRSPDQ